MDNNTTDKKILALAALSKEELVKRLMETKVRIRNVDGLVNLLDDFFTDLQIQKLSLSEWQKRRKRQKKNSSSSIHTSNELCTIDPKNYVLKEPILCIPTLVAPKETYLYGSHNRFSIQQIKNAFQIWINSKGNIEPEMRLWILDQSDRIWGTAFRKLEIGKWRIQYGYRYLLVVPAQLLEIFYQNRYAKVVST